MKECTRLSTTRSWHRRLPCSLERLANWIFTAIFLVATIRILGNTSKIVPGSAGKYVSFGTLWLIVIGCIFAQKLQLPSKLHIRHIMAAFCVLQFVYVWAMHSQVESDAYVLAYVGYHFAQGDYAALEGFWTDYLAVYPNNLPATMIITLVFTVWIPNTLEQSWLLLSGVAAVFSDVALIFIYKFVKKSINETAAITAVIFAFTLITLSEPTTIFYTDIMALWTTPAALYAICCGRSGEKKYFVAAGAILAYGSWVKPQSVVLTIAVCMAAILEWLPMESVHKKSALKSGALAMLGFLVVIGSLSCLKGTAIDFVGRERVTQNEMPAIHFVSMGLNPETNGAYSEDDVLEMKSVFGHTAKVELAKQKITSRLKELGINGVLKHIDNKILYGAGNGTFTSGLEWRGGVQNHSLQASRIQKWMMFSGEYFTRYTSIWIQCAYLLVLIMSLCSAVFAISTKTPGTNATNTMLANVCRFSMVGMMLMLIFLERNLRYMYAALPCMIFLAVYSLEKISLLLQGKIQSGKKAKI